MAINIGSYFSYKGKYFLDEREGLAKTKEELKSWSTPIPEGFEVYLEEDEEWYIFKSSTNDEETGHFKKRNQTNYDEIERIDSEIERIENKFDNEIERVETKFDEKTEEISSSLNNLISDNDLRHEAVFADKFNDLLLESNWVINGKNYCRKGIIVSVVNDTDEINGSYILKDEQYNIAGNWKKQLESSNLIKLDEIDNVESSDSNIYTAAAADKVFVSGIKPTTIESEWTFLNNIWLDEEKNNGIIKKQEENKETGQLEEITVGKFDKIEVKTSEIGDLYEHVRLGGDNIIKNSGFTGNFKSLELNSDTPINETLQLFSKPEEFWGGVGLWEIVETEDSISGYGVKLTKDYSYLTQELDPIRLENEEPYVISFKSNGTITVELDEQTFTGTANSQENFEDFKFSFTWKQSENNIIRITGEGVICNIKLEKGTIKTDWTRSVNDSRPELGLLSNSLEYLRTAFQEYNGDVTSGIFLKNVLQVGNLQDDTIKTEGGVSSIYSNEDSVFIWSGGSYLDATSLVSKIKNGAGQEELNNEKTKFVITFNGDAYINSLKIGDGDLIIPNKNKILDLGEINVDITVDGSLSIFNDILEEGIYRFTSPNYYGSGILEVFKVINSNTGEDTLRQTLKGCQGKENDGSYKSVIYSTRLINSSGPITSWKKNGEIPEYTLPSGGNYNNPVYITNNTVQSCNPKFSDLISNIDFDGDGTRFLSNDGTYREVTSSPGYVLPNGGSYTIPVYVSNNTIQSCNPKFGDVINYLTFTGNGDKYLTDNGSYKEINIPSGGGDITDLGTLSWDVTGTAPTVFDSVNTPGLYRFTTNNEYGQGLLLVQSAGYAGNNDGSVSKFLIAPYASLDTVGGNISGSGVIYAYKLAGLTNWRKASINMDEWT